ncbi:ABC transporter ATP-binding protein [Corynebacterium genitalium ATCC 33030]|uniref:ABC transporter, ATP-binding protein n=1 Tax=Corynebacterium genitalium ATCC 33030 TaxID=585529 RepID=D7WFB6_9CORY|nr:ABC transporter ATP-binding protein [Corynebacterium genitalium]EFK54550.1 ABC transporter, ATP-binding protein [Corynebacterium genitalium ATCC 33030]UUA89964.1 ABC transporter ATP-binding protein [Corynebacterium genitalium ATCC 33030]
MIETQNVSKHFGSVKAVEDVSLSIGRGEIVGLLGRNGAGKTTLVDLILGLTKPTSGTVRVADMTPAQAIRDARIGAVMQTGGLLDTVTVKDTLAMINSTHRDSIGVEAAIEQANLTKIQNRRVGKCSGGEQQRVRFAIALLGKPDILILDEPTTGMDATSRHEFWDTMRAQAHSGRTIIFSTHYLEEAENLAERIIVLDRGELIADGPTDSLTAGADKKRVTAQSSQGLIDVTTQDSDSYARKLLTETDAHDLTVTRTSLEDSFIALTSDDPESEEQP